MLPCSPANVVVSSSTIRHDRIPPSHQTNAVAQSNTLWYNTSHSTSTMQPQTSFTLIRQLILSTLHNKNNNHKIRWGTPIRSKIKYSWLRILHNSSNYPDHIQRPHIKLPSLREGVLTGQHVVNRRLMISLPLLINTPAFLLPWTHSISSHCSTGTPSMVKTWILYSSSKRCCNYSIVCIVVCS